MSANPPFLTDEEIFEIAKPLTQAAAIVRWFKANGFENLKVRPNGLPLISRPYYDQVTAGKPITAAEDTPSTQPNVEAFLQKIARGSRAKAPGSKV